MLFRQLFDPESSTYTYLLADEKTREAVLIDPVLDQIERDVTLLQELGLTLRYALDTHVHADHVTALGALHLRLDSRRVLSERAGVGHADVLVRHGSKVPFGSRHLLVLETPGHTAGCVTYVTDDGEMAFTGDALLIRGCGRTDFQQGDADAMYRSVKERIFKLDDDTRVYPGHDYKGRTVTTVREERAHNPRLRDGVTLEQFRDVMANLQLARPKKIDTAVPLNLYCGVPRGAHAAIDTGDSGGGSAWAPVVTSPGGVPEVEPEWVAARADPFEIVDVREPGEFTDALGHIPGAKLVPLATLGEQAASWPRERELVLVCRSGGRSGRAALNLVSMGFTRVASMRGGMTEWTAQRLPAER